MSAPDRDALSKQFIVNLLDKVNGLSLPADVKGAIYGADQSAVREETE
jgi:hypothetical protein